MKLRHLLYKAFGAALSPSANESILPYFWGCVLWLSIASTFIPFLGYVEAVGGVVFFVIMSSLITNGETSQRRIPSWSVIAKRTATVILTSIVSSIIILIGMLLLIIPGVIASKQLIYSGLVAAASNTTPFQALKKSKELSKANGYTLLGGTMLLVLPIVILSSPDIFLGPLLWSLHLGTLGSIAIRMIFNIILAWLSCLVGNHMIIIAYKEAAQETI